MRSVVSSRIRGLSGYTPGEQPPAGARIIKLNTNENPYPASPKVARAVEAAVGRLHLYPEPLSDGVRRRAAALYGVTPENVLVGNGSDEILALCFKACCADGGRIAFSTPTYSLYRTLAEIAGVEVVEASTFDGHVPAALLGATANITFLCTPNSPLGYEIAADEVESVAERAQGLVVVDEAYVDFGGSTALALIAKHANLLVLRTLSKSFSLAGARIGLGFAEPALIGELAKVKDSYNVSRLAQAVGEAALEDPDWMRQNVARVIATRERVASELRAMGFRVPESSANFVWMDCSSLGGRAVYEALRRRGILVRFFDAPGLTDGVRVSIGTDEDMTRFLAAVADVSRSR